MSSLLVFPFCREISDFVRCSDMVADFDIIIPVSLDSLAAAGMDAGICDGGSMTGQFIRNDLEAALREVDAAFISTVPMVSDTSVYREAVDLVLKSGKKLFITESLSSMLGADYLGKGIVALGFEDAAVVPDRFTNLFSLSVPIIFIMGTGENCDKFTIELKIGNFFRNKGYRVLQYGTKPFSKLFGIRPMPRVLFENKSVKSKIYAINRIIYSTVREEKPELVIIGIPGGMIPGNPFRFGDFGESAYVIANAFTPDLSILSTYAQPYSEDFYSHLISICKYKYNSIVNYVNISNTDYFVSFEYKTNEYIRVPTEKLGEVFGKFSELSTDVQYFSGFDTESFGHAADRMLDELTKNM